MAVKDIYHRVFIMSRQQMEELKERNNQLGLKTEFGKVIVNGVERAYSDIILDMADCRYSDAVKVIEGDIRAIKHTEVV